jgi:hypothetical protein
MTEYGDGQIITITVVVVALVIIMIHLMALTVLACCSQPKPTATSRSVQTNTCYIIDSEFANDTIPEETEVAPCDVVVLISDV